jgi:hypothetical protein
VGIESIVILRPPLSCVFFVFVFCLFFFSVTLDFLVKFSQLTYFRPQGGGSRSQFFLEVVHVEAVLVRGDRVGGEVEVLEGVDGQEITGVFCVHNIPIFFFF